MKITEVTHSSIHIVETDEAEYWRCSSDNWLERMGESLEPVYDDKIGELEALFQDNKT
jgi:hypothetical protein